MYFVWVCLIMGCEGSHFALYPAVFPKIYGNKMGAKLYAFLTPSSGASAIASALVQRYWIEDIGYDRMWTILTLMTVFSLTVLITVFKESTNAVAPGYEELEHESLEDEDENSDEETVDSKKAKA